MKRVLTCLELDAKRLKEAQTENCDTVIANFCLVGVNQLNGIKFIDANSYRKPGSWLAFNENRIAIQSLKLKVPNFFRFMDFDLTSAIEKDAICRVVPPPLVFAVPFNVLTGAAIFYLLNVFN